MNRKTLAGRPRTHCVAILLAVLGLFAAACEGTPDVGNTGSGEEPVEREELANPADEGEDVLANLPEVNPPLGAGDPRIVGSEDMTIDEFVQTIGGDLNAKWQALFQESGYYYANADFVLFDEPMPIAGCEGVANPEWGPFYCSETQGVYYPPTWVDPSGQSPAEIGDFAVAMILAHEQGHHVQNLLGILQDPRFYTIQRELQADCLAGIWGRSVYEEGSLERGDVEEAVQSLQNVADLPGTPPTDPAAHGNEQQRVDAFMTGFESGDVGECTF